MAKITLNNVTSGFNVSTINSNFEKLEDALNEGTLWRDNPEGEPNQLQSDIDVNDKRLYNLPDPQEEGEAVNLRTLNQFSYDYESAITEMEGLAESAQNSALSSQASANSAAGQANIATIKAQEAYNSSINAAIAANLAENAKNLSSYYSEIAKNAAEASGDRRVFDTYALAAAALPAMPELQIVEVFNDETNDGAHTLYRVEGGVLVFKINLDYLEQELANATDDAKGASMIGFKGLTVSNLLDSIPIPEMFGITGSGVDESTVLNLYFSVMTALGYPVRLQKGKTYTTNGLVIPDNCIIEGNEATFALAGTITNGFNIGNNCQVFNVHFTTSQNPGTCYIGEGSSVKLTITSTVEVQGTVYIHPSATYVDMETYNLIYPYFIRNWNLDYSGIGEAPLGGQGLKGKLKARTYRRALRADAADYFDLEVDFQERDSGAASDPGHNGILINGCCHFKINGIIQGSGEHCIRFGSSGINRASTDWYFGDILVGKSGGCGFKINPDAAYPVRRGFVNTLLGVDVGLDASDTGRNDEFIRISSAYDITFNYARHICVEMPNVISGLRMSEAQNITFNYLDAGPCGEYVRFVEEGDTSGLIDNIRILNGRGIVAATGAIQFQREIYPVGNIFIKAELSGAYTYYAQGHTSSTTLLSGPVRLDITAFGGASTRYFTLENDVQAKLVYQDGRTYEGHVNLRQGAVREFNGPNFDSTDVNPNTLGFLLDSPSVASAIGATGSAVNFKRPASGRRGGSVSIEQVGTADNQTGISIHAGAAGTATNAIRKIGVFRFDGFLELPFRESNGIGSGLILTDNVTGVRKRLVIANNVISITDAP